MDSHSIRLTLMRSRQYRWQHNKGRHLLIKPVSTVQQTNTLLITSYSWKNNQQGNLKSTRSISNDGETITNIVTVISHTIEKHNYEELNLKTNTLKIFQILNIISK